MAAPIFDRLSKVFPRTFVLRHEIQRLSSTTNLNIASHNRMGVWLRTYENLIGLTSVREAQEQVIKVSF